MPERVYTIHDFFDVPISGLADFQGRPHWFERQFDKTQDDWSDKYALSPVSIKVVVAETETQTIFHAWLAEFDRGRVAQDTGPALPHHRERYEELRAFVEHEISAISATTFFARGAFTGLLSQRPKPGMGEFVVEWTPMAS